MHNNTLARRKERYNATQKTKIEQIESHWNTVVSLDVLEG